MWGNKSCRVGDDEMMPKPGFGTDSTMIMGPMMFLVSSSYVSLS